MNKGQKQSHIGALKGVRVLDLSRVLAGPWASQLLGDLGADVIKVERPGKGDDTRSWGPPFLSPEQNGDGAHLDSAYYLSANRNKRSVAIDISSAEGVEVIKKMAVGSDILLENFKVGGLKKYGLDYPSIAAINPKIVYCSITGFGQEGPYANRPGYDFMIQAMAGLMSITGQPDGAPGGEPVRAGVAVADLFTGMYAATTILAALRHAENTGEGQHLDVSLFDCQTAMLANQASNYLVSGEAPGRLGNAHPNIAPYQVVKSSDGYFVLAVGNDSQFSAFANLLGRPGLSDDPRFAQNADRVANREALLTEILPHLAKETSNTWLERCEKANVPAGPINSIDEVFSSPQAIFRNLSQEVARNGASPIKIGAHPVKFSKTNPEGPTPPPTVGQHTDEVLEEFLTDAELDALKARGIVG